LASTVTHLLLAVKVKSPVTLGTGALVIGQFPCFFIAGDVVCAIAQNTPQFGRFIFGQFLAHNLFRLYNNTENNKERILKEFD